MEKVKVDLEKDDLKELEPFQFEHDHVDFESDHDQIVDLGWNVEEMLAINEKKYGYKSTFNAEMKEYTIPVEKEDTEEFRKRERVAERLAREIESDLNYKRNIDKELSDNEDEEEAFSAVIRPSYSYSNVKNHRGKKYEVNNNSQTYSNKNYHTSKSFSSFSHKSKCKFEKLNCKILPKQLSKA